jgi:hypothetical protein
MGKLAIAAALFLLGGPEAEQDILYLKDGREIKGIIVSETDQLIKVAVLSKGSKGQTGGVITVGHPVSNIARVERMSAAKRDRLLRKYKGFRERRSRKAEAQEKIKTRRVSLQGKRALRARGTHFEVHSTCDEEFVMDVAFYLDEIFAAYKDSFAIQRNADKLIPVYVLSDKNEYMRFQRARIGAAIQNPAFYHSGKNFIAAYNMIQKEEAAKIRKQIHIWEREIREYEKKAKDWETEVRKHSVKTKSKIKREAETERRKVKAGNYANKNALLRKIKQWEDQELGGVDSWRREEKKKVDAYREEIKKYIGHNRKVIAKNHKVLLNQNKAMFEALFHEGFHAFALNFLWVRGGKSAVPRWLDEGLASYYEMSAVDADELVHGAPHPGFLGLIRKASTEGKLLAVEDILRADPMKFLVVHRSQAERSTLHYAQSWAIAHYMAGRVPREKIQAYVVAVKNGTDSVKAFRKMMGGRPVRTVEAEVRHHLEKLD